MLRPQEGLRLVLPVAGLVMLLVAIAYAAPIGALKQSRVPTNNSGPRYITQGSDGNFWFTEGSPQGLAPGNVGRITPNGDITEFAVCASCFPNDIVQGPNDILYLTSNDPVLGRITTSGEVLPAIAMPNSLANGNGLTAHGDDIWIATFNVNSIWRYNISSGQFTEFPVPTAGAIAFDIAVDATGIVWFTEFGANQIGRLDPQTGVITETPVPGSPRGIAIATDGKVWFTERFSNAVGYLDPLTNAVTEILLAPGAGPEGIAAAPNGSLWVTQSSAGNIAQVTASGVIAESRRIKGSEPLGITVAANGDPWFAELSANKIAVLQLR